ncbi:acyltransferase family protein [Actinoplanes sp. HUAS TT8]|uniref:acyltransferase family protein n=1 Tax=Actinoplanes sp. HUAS TT8 TaxID=3447453 RepID=UPI003F51CF4B
MSVIPAARTAPTPSAPPQRRPRLVALDGLRFIAALAVIAAHFVGLNSHVWQDTNKATFPSIHYASVYGIFGVEFFFLISGFVICMSCWGRSLGEFFVSRIVRLYPVYWAAILLIAVTQIRYPQPGTEPPKIGTILVNLTMFNMPAMAPGMTVVVWTLWQEMRFYLLFCLVVWRGLTYRRVTMFCLLWLVGSFIANSADDKTLKLIFQPEYAEYFIAGIAIYLMHRFGPTMLTGGIVVCCWALAMFAVEHRVTENMRSMGRNDLAWWPAQVVITGCFLVIIALALGWLNWVRGGWITTLGAMTYPIYLIHHAVGLTVIRELSPTIGPWKLLFGTTLLMMLLAWLVHRFVERPLVPILKRGLTRAIAEMNTKGDQFGRSKQAEPPAPVPATPEPARPSDGSAEDTLVLDLSGRWPEGPRPGSMRY